MDIVVFFIILQLVIAAVWAMFVYLDPIVIIGIYSVLIMILFVLLLKAPMIENEHEYQEPENERSSN